MEIYLRTGEWMWRYDAEYKIMMDRKISMKMKGKVLDSVGMMLWANDSPSVCSRMFSLMTSSWARSKYVCRNSRNAVVTKLTHHTKRKCSLYRRNARFTRGEYLHFMAYKRAEHKMVKIQVMKKQVWMQFSSQFPVRVVTVAAF